jgi:hypothetical protein
VKCRDCGAPSDPEQTMDFSDIEPGALLFWCTPCGERAHAMKALLDEALADDPRFAAKLEHEIEKAERSIQ